MPRPTEQQIAYMALCVVTELDAIAHRATKAGQDAVSARDRMGRIIRDGGQMPPDLLERMIDAADRLGAEVQELEGNLRNLAHSELALNLARRSLT
jgi:hypothetical protein